MFEIKETMAKIRSINPRAELHGDDTALACDISLELTVDNKKLTLLDGALLGALYTDQSGSAASSQESLSLDDDVFLPHVRFPLLGKITWGYEGVGYTFVLLNDTLMDDAPLELGDCKINKFSIECQEGGTVVITVRVQCSPEEDDIADLCHFIQKEVKVSLLPPAVMEDPQQDGIGDDNDNADLEAGLQDAANQ